MDHQKLRQIISRKNENLEQEACDRARRIIDEIGEQQNMKASADRRILELRAELKTLEVQQIDETSILGG